MNIKAAREIKDDCVGLACLGDVSESAEVKSIVGRAKIFSEHKVEYPQIVIETLCEIYLEYNRAFIPLLEKNQEFSNDYILCKQNGMPINYAIQIDMAGLNDEFLFEAGRMEKGRLKKELKKKIFEIENSLAMYNYLEQAFSGGNDSSFKTYFRTFLDNLRKRLKRPIALLAVTTEKYVSMKAYEFGKVDEPLTDEEVKEISGFDKFFGPNEFLRHLKDNNNVCDYALYVRSSNPIGKMKNPKIEVAHPLLTVPEIRKVIKENAITFNVDNPESDSVKMINDTKEYMPFLDMGYVINSESELYSFDFMVHMASGGNYSEYIGNRLSKTFSDYLGMNGVDPKDVESGKIHLRFKPAKGCYGCYGHVSGFLGDRKVRSELRKNLNVRTGGYVTQVEIPTERICNSVSGCEYSYVDRNFFCFTNGSPRFMGGFRSFMPVQSVENKKGRNHGSKETVMAEIKTAY